MAVVCFGFTCTSRMSGVVFLSNCHVASIMIQSSKTSFHSGRKGLSCVVKLLPQRTNTSPAALTVAVGS